MKKSSFLGGLGVLIVLAVGSTGAEQRGVDDVQISEKPAAISVTVAPLSEVLQTSEKRVSAQAVSLNHTQISTQATGEVIRINVDVGEEVQKGTNLVELDCRQSELEQEEANVSFELAVKEFKRVHLLGRTKLVAEQQITQTQSALDQARIRKRQAAISVEHCFVNAPFDGVVTSRQIQLGALAILGAPVLELLQLNAVEVEAQMTSSELSSLLKTNEIIFETGEARYQIKLRSVLPLVNSLSNKRIVRFQFITEPSFAGSVGDIVWPLSSGVLPVDFVVQREGQLGYFVVNNNHAQFIPLEDAKMGHPAAIDPSIEDEPQVELIIEGRYRVESGSPVDIIP